MPWFAFSIFYVIIIIVIAIFITVAIIIIVTVSKLLLLFFLFLKFLFLMANLLQVNKLNSLPTRERKKNQIPFSKFLITN